jgi:hypothetical protein
MVPAQAIAAPNAVRAISLFIFENVIGISSD